MPVLAATLLGLFTGLVTFFVNFLSKRLAIAVALLVAVVALTGAVYSAIVGLLGGIAYVMPNFVNDGICWLLPSNLNACISAMIVGKVIEYGYIWNVKIIQWKLL